MKKFNQLKSAIFGLDHPIMQMSNLILNLATINLLFVLTSLPLITIGASKTTFYRVLFKLNEQPNLPIISTYYNEWKQEWRQSIWLGLGELVLYGLILFDLSLVAHFHSSVLTAFKVVGYASLFLISAVFLYVYPINAKFMMTNREILKKSLLMALLNGQWTIISLLVLGGLLLVMRINLLSFYLTLFIFIMIGWSILGYLQVKLLNHLWQTNQKE